MTDLVYGPAVHERGDGFTAAQSVCNLVENAINFAYIALWRKGSPIAPLVGLVGATATAWKTVSCLAQRHRPNCHLTHCFLLTDSVLADGLSDHRRRQAVGDDRSQH